MAEEVVSTPANTDEVVSDKAMGTIFISSSPALAEVYLNGKMVGKSSRAPLSFPVGNIILTFKKGYLTAKKEVNIVKGTNEPMHVVLE